MKHAEAIEWLREAARYFSTRDTGGEDRAHWSNVSNSENALKIADLLERAPRPGQYEALADILKNNDINSLDGVAVATTLRAWANADQDVKKSLTTTKKEPLETKIARHMLARTIEKYSTVDGLCEALADHPEKTLSFLSGAALDIVRNSYRFS